MARIPWLEDFFKDHDNKNIDKKKWVQVSRVSFFSTKCKIDIFFSPIYCTVQESIQKTHPLARANSTIYKNHTTS